MTTSLLAFDLGTLPPSERARLAVYPDDEVAAARAKPTWRDVVLSKSRTVGKTARRAVLGPLLSIPVELAIDAIAKQACGLNVCFVTRAEFKCAEFAHPGRLEPRLLYVIHPKDPNVYYPAAQFHQMVFEHKFAELLRLLVALGATEVAIEHEQGWTQEAAGSIDMPVPEATGTVDATVKGNAGAKSKILFTANYPGSTTPAIPAGLVWLPDETIWRAVAESRLQGGMEDFSLRLRYDDDFGVNANLIAQVEGANIGIGGKFTSHRDTVWKIEGRFSKACVSPGK